MMDTLLHELTQKKKKKKKLYVRMNEVISYKKSSLLHVSDPIKMIALLMNTWLATVVLTPSDLHASYKTTSSNLFLTYNPFLRPKIVSEIKIMIQDDSPLFEHLF